MTLMPAMVPRVMGAVPVDAMAARDAVAAAGGGATLGAPFAVTGLHAGLDPGAIRNELSAQPHGVRRAGLLNVRSLGGGRPGGAD